MIGTNKSYLKLICNNYTYAADFRLTIDSEGRCDNWWVNLDKKSRSTFFFPNPFHVSNASDLTWNAVLKKV